MTRLPRPFRAAAVALSLFAAGLGHVAAARADVLSDAKARGELIVGTELNFAPFEFLDGTTPVGFDVDLITMIAKDNGLKVKWVDLPWASVLPGLEAKKFDMVIAGTTITQERLKHYDFTLPIGDATVALVKLKSNTAIQKPEDVAGKVVGGVKASSQMKQFQDWTKTLPGGVKDFKVYMNSAEAYADLAAGRIVATSGGLPNLAFLVKNQPQFALVLPPIGKPSYLAWPLRKEADSASLLKMVDEGIAKYNKDGTITKLQEKWFGAKMAIPYENVPAPNF